MIKTLKLFLIIIFLSVFAQAQNAKIKKLSPFQQQVKKCFNEDVDVKSITDSKKLYLEIVKNFNLQASETTFREIEYAQKGVTRKLRFEDGVIKIFLVDADSKVTLEKSEDLNAASNSKGSGLRYKITSLEDKIAQLLNRADVKSDFIKTTEVRSKQTVLNIVWSDNAIKSMSVLLKGGEKKLECQKKQSTDICDCSG